jgi:hypothetical protein
MEIEVKTKQGTNYIVDTEAIALWLEIEEQFDVTYFEASELLKRQSLGIMTKMFFVAAKLQGKTELKTLKKWVELEFDSFDLVGEDSPKELEQEA